MFKYSEKKYIDLLISSGSVRIGTLYDFRRSEHKQGVADPQEGKKTVTHKLEDRYTKDSPGTAGLKQFGIHIEGGELISKGSLAINNITQEDCYIFCISSDLSVDVLNQFEGANDCAVILRQADFFHVLTQKINEITPVKFEGVFPVSYQERTETWNGTDQGISPALIKELGFSDQKEIRAVWTPLNPTSIKPEIIQDGRLAKCCARVPDISWPR